MVLDHAKSHLDVDCLVQTQQQIPLPHNQQQQTTIIIIAVAALVTVYLQMLLLAVNIVLLPPPLPPPVIVVIIRRLPMPRGNKFRMLLTSHPQLGVLYPT